MILNPAKALEKGWIENVEDPNEQVQQHGIDVRVEEVIELMTPGKILKNDKVLPGDRIVLPHMEKMKDNAPEPPQLLSIKYGHAYVINAIESVKIPENIAAIAIMRSTLNRIGVPIHSALYDSGFRGKIQSTLYAFNDCDIELGARYAQVIFLEAESAGMYNGQYQDQGLQK